MRGSPLFRLLCTAIALVLAGIPVWVITRPIPPRAPAGAIAPATSHRAVNLTLTASAPAALSATLLGKTILESAEPIQTLSAPLSINSENPDDLVVAARWEGSAAPQALRVEISDASGTIVDQTLWGAETIEESISPVSP